jgi:hypothetical protein
MSVLDRRVRRGRVGRVRCGTTAVRRQGYGHLRRRRLRGHRLWAGVRLRARVRAGVRCGVRAGVWAGGVLGRCAGGSLRWLRPRRLLGVRRGRHRRRCDHRRRHDGAVHRRGSGRGRLVPPGGRPGGRCRRGRRRGWRPGLCWLLWHRGLRPRWRPTRWRRSRWRRSRWRRPRWRRPRWLRTRHLRHDRPGPGGHVADRRAGPVGPRMVRLGRRRTGRDCVRCDALALAAQRWRQRDGGLARRRGRLRGRRPERELRGRGRPAGAVTPR